MIYKFTQLQQINVLIKSQLNNINKHKYIQSTFIQENAFHPCNYTHLLHNTRNYTHFLHYTSNNNHLLHLYNHLLQMTQQQNNQL